MNSNFNSRTADKFVIRLLDGMRDQLSSVAKDEHISMNSLVIRILEDGLNPSVIKWTPVVGMVVTVKSNGKPALLEKIYIEDGVVICKVNETFSGNTASYPLPVTALQPFIARS